MLIGHQLRSDFLGFFEKKGHTIVASDSLVPNDPTLLFTTAGMVQFKPHFEGSIPLTYRRAVTSQKCLRASGKQNDLEEVGKTNRHFTFFEMLGNFSFGDYFKREAIQWAWEFITEVAKIPSDRLWVSIYLDDDPAFDMWTKDVGFRAERIVRLGMKDNFWPPVVIPGPCGPCSEIFIDLGPEMGCGEDTCQPGCDCNRFFEFWNLVFQTYTRDNAGELHPLPTQNIDTGMCLERLSMLVQGLDNIFDVDLVRPIIDFMSDLTDTPYGETLENTYALRVLADHVRCLTFAISDGVMPSNEGRGYVLRRILRRGVRYGSKIGMKEPFIYKGVDKVVKIMGNVYPELVEKRDLVKRVILSEEERFQRTLEQGLERLDTIMSSLGNEKIISGKSAFELYDTYGFPLDLTQNVASEKGFIVDETGFESAMEEQRERGRSAWQTAGGIFQSGVYGDIIKEYGATDFKGYEQSSLTANIVAIVKDNELLSSAQEGDEVEIVLDKTPFYGEVGGQVGDIGWLSNDNVKIQVLDSVHPIPDIIAHKCKVISGGISSGDSVTASIDTERRQKIAVNHTATHILQSALREVLGSHVAQSGSMVAPDRLRFDFNHFEAMKSDEIKEVEKLVNRHIRENTPVITSEKYGDVVRVVQLDNYSKELCGGTHIKMTGEIGLLKIISESSIAAGIRRIEALTGESAYIHELDMEEQVRKIVDLLRVKPTDIAERVEALIQQNKELEKEITRLKQKNALSQSSELLNQIRDIKGVRVLAVVIDNADRDALRTIMDDLKVKIGSGVIVLGSGTDGKASFIAGVTDDLIKEKKLKAGDIIKQVAEIAGGSGGGRPDMAQAGGKEPSKVSEAVEATFNIIDKML
ncbi:TPA: alanine--tRNA ligase [bacterium]|nr:alanine--tRNA ligase [bacterium]